MLERKRQVKNYQIVPGDDVDDGDLELGESVGAQEPSLLRDEPPTTEEEVDNWDENAWDEDDLADTAENGDSEGQKTTSVSVGEGTTDGKKRSD